MPDIGIRCAVLMEVKISDGKHTKRPEGYEMIISNGKNTKQGEIALLWKKNHPMFDIESANAQAHHIITFHLTTGDNRFYVMAIYIAPTCKTGVSNLCNTC
jgi:hypothetical protein